MTTAVGGAAVEGRDRLQAGPVADRVAGGVAGLGGEVTVVDVDDQVPAPAGVEAERRLGLALAGRRPGTSHAEGVFELVAVPPLLLGGDDRLQLEALQPADPPQRLAHLFALDLQLALVRQPLPRSAGTGLAAVGAAVGDAVGAGRQQLDHAGLGEALLRFGHLDPHPVAREGAGDEHHEALGPGDTAPAKGERVDLNLERLAATRAAGRRLLAGGLPHP